MNRVELSGRLTADTKLKKTQSGKSVCHFTMAVKRPYSKDQTDFIRCTAWGQTADYLDRYGKKGMNVVAYGCLQVNTYTDRSGAEQKDMDVMADNVEIMFEPKKEQKPVQRDYDPVFDANWETADFQPSKPEDLVSFDDLPF